MTYRDPTACPTCGKLFVGGKEDYEAKVAGFEKMYADAGAEFDDETRRRMWDDHCHCYLSDEPKQTTSAVTDRPSL